MEKFNLEVPAVAVAVESRGVTINVDLTKIPHDVLRQVLAHGIKQKVADAASGVVGVLYIEAKGKDAPKPSRDQLATFAEANAKAVSDATEAAMHKAADALIAGQWQVRVAGGGTSSKWTTEQTLALYMAKEELKAIFVAALRKAKPDAKPTAQAFYDLSPKIAAFFKMNDTRPTWDDKPVMDWIKVQADKEGGRDFMAEARAEIARREAAVLAATFDLDEMLGDI